jgi:thiol-disulfide isomerase/thioredoxin
LGAQERTAFGSLDELNAAYGRRLLDLDRGRIADLAALAARLKGAEADAAYDQLFQFAISRGLSADAAAAAAACLASNSSSPECQRFAHLVRILARADKGEHGQALALFRELIEGHGGGKAPDPETAMAVGEAYLQRLLRDGRYGAARELCGCACDSETVPARVKEHFEARMGRVELVGKSAPPIAGADVDGKQVSLGVLKGKVVLVNFWATWCPPCVAAVPQLNMLTQRFRDRGFEILGVNVDALHEDVKDLKTALPVVRRFLVDHGCFWTCLLSGPGDDSITKAYGVAEIPANFLIDRDGKVIALELTGPALEQAINRAIGNDHRQKSK